MKVTAAKREDFAWIVQRTGCVPSPVAKAIKAVDASGRIRGMILYDGWTRNSVQAHMAVDAPIVWRSLAGPTFSYPFEEAGMGLLVGTIRASNTRSRRMAQRLGLRETYRIRDGWAPGEDLIIHEIRRDECRWIQRKAA